MIGGPTVNWPFQTAMKARTATRRIRGSTHSWHYAATLQPPAPRSQYCSSVTLSRHKRSLTQPRADWHPPLHRRIHQKAFLGVWQTDSPSLNDHLCRKQNTGQSFSCPCLLSKCYGSNFATYFLMSSPFAFSFLSFCRVSFSFRVQSVSWPFSFLASFTFLSFSFAFAIQWCQFSLDAKMPSSTALPFKTLQMFLNGPPLLQRACHGTRVGWGLMLPLYNMLQWRRPSFVPPARSPSSLSATGHIKLNHTTSIRDKNMLEDWLL